MPVRRALGVRTVLHVLGPLLNPAGARRQVMGVYASRLVPLVAEAMTMLGATHAMVVHGDATQDELALSGVTEIATVRDGKVSQHSLAPETLDLQRAPVAALAGGDAQQNAKILHSIFSGEGGPRRDIVLLNAAAVLVVADLAADLPHGINLAATAIETGAVLKLIERLKQ